MKKAQRDNQLIQECVNRILAGNCFSRSPQARRFLQFVVEKSVTGEAADLKAYTIGVSALGARDERSRPETIARMQASRVRRLLARYYQLEGQNDLIELVLRPGSYCPEFLAREVSEKPRTSNPSVLVLDFTSISEDKLDKQLASGLSESLLGLLVHSKQLKVLRGGECSEAEGAYTISGSVTRAGDAVRISCRLSGRNGREAIWSDRFDRELSVDSFLRVQDDVALRIASRIGDSSLGAVAMSERGELPENSVSFALQQFHELLANPEPEQRGKCLTALESVLSDERVTPEIHAAYSCVTSLGLFWADKERRQGLLSAEAHARSAISQDSTSSLGHLARGLVHCHLGESVCARRELLRCIELNPIAATQQGLCGLLIALMGHWKEGLKHLDAAIELAGVAPGYFQIAYSLYYFYEVGDCNEGLRRAERINLEDSLAGDLLACACLSRLGRLTQARSLASRISGRRPALAKNLNKTLAPFFFEKDLGVSLVAALSDAGLGSRSEPRRTQAEFKVALPRTALPAEIRVGILHSLSGSMAMSESHLVNAALLAIEEINQNGGVLGRPARALIEDGASSPATFRAKAQKLVNEEGVSSVFGCWTSSCRKAVLPVIEKANALLWYPLQYEGLERSKHVVYTGSCLNQQIEPAVRWALKRKRNRVYLVGSDYVFPRTVNRLIRALVESQGGRVMGESYQPLGTASFRETAQDIARLRPEFVYNTVNGADNIELFDALRQAGVSASDSPVMSFSLSELELSQCGPAAEGQLACWTYFQSLEGPKNKDLVARFRRRYGDTEVLSDPAVTAYSQIHLWKAVVNRAQSLETSALLEQLCGSRLELGDESFEVLNNHHVERRALIGKARGGQFDVIWTSPQPISPQPWLGVDTTESMSRDMILGALQALPEMAERSSTPPPGRLVAADARNAT